MLRAIIYNKIDGSMDEVLGVVSLDKNKKAVFCKDMDAELRAYLISGNTDKGEKFIESLPNFLAGTNLYAILKD
jgi:hypothetical protein